MSSLTKELMKITINKQLAHSGHLVLQWIIDNILSESIPLETFMQTKKSTENIDGAIATIWLLIASYGVVMTISLSLG